MTPDQSRPDAGASADSVIDRIEVIEYTYSAERMGRDALGNLVVTESGALTISSFALRMRTKGGAVGEYCPVWGGKKAQLGQVLMVAPLVLGRRVEERGLIFEDLKRALRQLGFLGLGALDICLWDLAGKQCGLPIIDMLGRYRTALPAYASTTHASEEGPLSTAEAFADFAEQCRELGYRAFKIHGWTDGNVRREVDNIVSLRKCMGDDFVIMIDPACVLRTFADALRVGRACDDADLFWYEDPFQDAGTSQHAARKLRQMLRTPMLLTEHVRGLEAKADWIAAEATDLVRADPELDMGITGAMRIAHLAEAFGLDVEVHGCGPAHRHCMGAIRNTNYYELALVGPGAPNGVPPVHSCGYSDQLEAVDAAGCFHVPIDQPGLGVTCDWEFVSAHAKATHAFGARS